VSSVTFNGTNQYGTASDNGLPAGSGSFTVSWWQKTSNSAGSDFYAWSWGLGVGTSIQAGMYQNKLFVYNGSSLLIQSSVAVNDGAWHHGAATYDGTTVRLYLDGTQVVTTTITLGTIKNGRFRVATPSTSSSFWPGSLTGIRVYSAALSAGDITTLAAGGNPSATPLRQYNFSEGVGTTLANSGSLPNPQPQLICDGNSLTAGIGSSNANTEGYPAQLQSLLGVTWTSMQFGVGGQTTEDMNSDANTQIDGFFDSHRSKNIVVAWEGINSINNVNDTAAQAYTAMTTYIHGRQAAGFKVIVLTTMKWGTITAPKEVIRQAYNALVLANSAGADAVVDVASDSHLTDPTNTTYFSSDTIHLVDAGYAVVAGLVRPVVLAQ
jgi:lysophospholipase L1-like esterase